MRTGLLFTGGAARCVFQVGVVEELFAAGVRPAAVLGVSGGAWNAAAVGAGEWRRLRPYWKFFSRMPYVDLSNLLREHSPFIWRRLHERAFMRYVGAERVRAAEIPILVALTRRRDRKSVIVDIRAASDPFEVLLASNYLPPYYTHTPLIDGERYGDGGISDNLPYERLFELGCDRVIIISQKGECEGGLFRTIDEPDHEIPPEFRERVTVIRPRHMLDVGFMERRWERMAPIADLGAARARQVLGGIEDSSPLDCDHGHRPSWYFVRARRWLRSVLAQS
jgi:predicted acylesterase/phospholipase RssA